MLFEVLYTTSSLTDNLEEWDISDWCAMSYWDLERACSILCSCRARGRKSVFKTVLTESRWKCQSRSEGTENGQELLVRERMATRGQTGAWWETVNRDTQGRSVCKSSQHSLLNLLLYNCHHCTQMHVHMCVCKCICTSVHEDVECLPQSFSFYSLGRVSCWTQPSLVNFSLVCLASQLCSRTSYSWFPRLGWLVTILPTYFIFYMDAGDPNSHPHTCMTSTFSHWAIPMTPILERPPTLSFQKDLYRGILYKRLKYQDWYFEISTNDCSK